jgi:hypothetical protein
VDGIDPDLRDVDDQPVLGTLLAALQLAQTNYLITGNKDLLTLAKRYPIVSPAELWVARVGL